MPTSIRTAAVAAVVSVSVAAPAGAQLEPGSTVDYRGALVLDAAGGTLTVRFSPEPNSLVLGTANTGSFAFLNGLSGKLRGMGTAFAATVGPQDAPAFVTLGAGQFPFVTRAATFDLRAVLAGTAGQGACDDAPALGQTCTPLGAEGTPTPFTFENVGWPHDAARPIGSVLHVGVLATVREFGGAPVMGTLTLNLSGVPYQDALATLRAGGTLSGGFEGRFTAAVVPEPGVLALTAAGLLAAATARRRRPAC